MYEDDYNNNGYGSQQGYNDDALDWDDEIEKESQFTLVPEGDYNFTVVNLERRRYAGGPKLGPCNQAVITLRLDTREGPVDINYNLFLSRKMEWKLCDFFNGIGQRQHGTRSKMDWNRVVGSRGRCKVKVRKGNDQYKYDSNDIEKFYDPPQAAPMAQPQPQPQQQWTPGKFA